jgi:hypothetical protein
MWLDGLGDEDIIWIDCLGDKHIMWLDGLVIRILCGLMV